MGENTKPHTLTAISLWFHVASTWNDLVAGVVSAALIQVVSLVLYDEPYRT